MFGNLHSKTLEIKKKKKHPEKSWNTCTEGQDREILLDNQETHKDILINTVWYYRDVKTDQQNRTETLKTNP